MKRRNRYPRRDARAGFSVFIIIIILAVAAGYAGTKYIVFPYLLGNDPASENQNSQDNTATDTAVDVIPNSPSVIIDQQNLKNDTPGSAANNGNSDVISGTGGPFSVQFGSFSTKTGADKFSAELTGKGIYSYVYESDGSYKVLGLPYSTEAKAREAAAVVSAAVSDVFVVNLSNLIP
ncbi:MAG TPA: SPOR domain-containing protein [Anaerovoracaceae bacterium]|nr:SPOR domain-containing protein [Anaerovoracaceae bacterium]